jgi:hypothetical protein
MFQSVDGIVDFRFVKPPTTPSTTTALPVGQYMCTFDLRVGSFALAFHTFLTRLLVVREASGLDQEVTIEMWFTGMSLGGALAQLGYCQARNVFASHDLVRAAQGGSTTASLSPTASKTRVLLSTRVMVMASPKVGNRLFRKNVLDAREGHPMEGAAAFHPYSSVLSFQEKWVLYANRNDPVTLFPVGKTYQHVVDLQVPESRVKNWVTGEIEQLESHDHRWYLGIPYLVGRSVELPLADYRRGRPRNWRFQVALVFFFLFLVLLILFFEAAARA